jgi:IS5 family transposase
MAGLHYLKYAFDETDESVLYWFLENPYWQYFCGYDYFQKTCPVDPSSLTRFRKRIGTEGLNFLLEELKKTISQIENQSKSTRQNDT